MLLLSGCTLGGNSICTIILSAKTNSTVDIVGEETMSGKDPSIHQSKV